MKKSFLRLFFITFLASFTIHDFRLVIFPQTFEFGLLHPNLGFNIHTFFHFSMPLYFSLLLTYINS
ncbi:uncharacterized protein F4807DRAFT_433993 [Annulohypoxylon truncatum]|uniref:uncharacterized protein n=1 Tax=Annulohypoxylon truncatum TaxID=327061 RepID=UPI00200789CC|nr:uncharacterized protein F4807DRAFT_433993 [Annulohypoxylon truncatum]KAI1207632.1 hypothetical protein F4807DRAFT_433993 [Annulohypoxylon truncatum]